MAEETIGDLVDTRIDYKLEQLPANITGIITNTYADNYCDIRLDNTNQILSYVKCIGTPIKDTNALVVFTDSNLNNPIVITSDTFIFQKFGLDQSSAGKFNYAVINRVDGEVTYEEFWILANAYYDYNVDRFIKIEEHSSSFGIQIQAQGTYPGEQQLGYTNNTGINIWRNPIKSEVWKDTTNYDYTDFENKNYIGAKKKSDNSWVEFGISSGWNNSFMVDSYGGMTIGGAGFEIDGNGLYPFTRLTHSIITINNSKYALVGILDNAYHGSTGCDDNSTYSWFVGLKTPVNNNNEKNNANASFVVMYNDTTYSSSDKHNIDNTKWHIVFEVNKDGVV